MFLLGVLHFFQLLSLYFSEMLSEYILSNTVPYVDIFGFAWWQTLPLLCCFSTSETLYWWDSDIRTRSRSRLMQITINQRHDFATLESYHRGSYYISCHWNCSYPPEICTCMYFNSTSCRMMMSQVQLFCPTIRLYFAEAPRFILHQEPKTVSTLPNVSLNKPHIHPIQL